MTRFSLLLRNLRHFRLANLAVMAGMVVATAVLTGAMMVGDSVRESLRVLAIQRLGPVDYALVATRFFDQSLAQRVHKAAGGAIEESHSAILVRGGASNEKETSRTAGVQIAAIDGPWVPVAPGAGIINGELGGALGIDKPGETLLLNLPLHQDAPLDAPLARRGRTDTLSGLRPKIVEIATQPGIASMFNLSGGQRLPRNAWVNLADLQDAVGQGKRANVLLAKVKPIETDRSGEWLKEAVTLDDYGLSIAPSADKREALLGSRDTYLLRPVEEAANRVAAKLQIPLRGVSAYLTNTAVNLAAKEPTEIHYAMIAGTSSLDGGLLAENEIAINQWTADHLNAKVGDSIRLDYYQRQPNGELKDVRSDRPGVGVTFRVARVLPMEGIGADPTLTPTYKGLTDSDSVRDWHAPEGITIRNDWITKDDEAYWKQHRAAPKMFINLDTARKLWGGPFGDVTSIRLPADKAQAFADELRRQIDPASMGLIFRPVKAEQLAATSGSTDFAELFISFSFFLIIAAVLLVAMLFRLNIEQRARQLGLLAAIGFKPKQLRRMALFEGLIVAVVGAAIGLPGAIGYTWLMMAGLRTWWVDAVGTTAMNLHVVPQTLAIGFITSVIVAALAILWGVWRIGRTPAGRLLAGGWGAPTPSAHRRDKWAVRIGAVLLLMAIGLLGCGIGKAMSPQEAFLGGGTLLLFGGLTLLGAELRPKRGGSPITSTVRSLGFRNASRHTSRSVLTMGLIAFATFALVTVAAMRGANPEDSTARSSGTGGYRLMAQADIPLLGDPGTKEGRQLLGIRDANDPLWSRAKFTSLRRWSGEDISCLNLTRPGSPTILAVPPEMVSRTGEGPKDHHAFTFAQQIRKTDNPWTLLEGSDASGVPVIADNETAQYILHLGLGKTLEMTDQTGTPRKLVLVGTISGSIFQGQLLMGEANFRNLFPSQSGAGVVLVDVDATDAEAVAGLLSSELGDFSVTVEPTAKVLAMYDSVKNTYLSTFQVLGSLGLLLGSVGLAVVLLRGLVERKAELAMLAAIGFRRADRLRMILAENVMLLALGLGIGTLCAIIAMLPALVHSAQHIHMIGLAITLVGVLAAGLISLVLAVWFGGRQISPADLRAE